MDGHIWAWPYEAIHHLAKDVSSGMTAYAGFVNWAVIAVLDGIFGLIYGLLLIPIGTRVVGPIWGKLGLA